ncbi:hypothetical protein ACP4OV_027082 [Aristida adscensionis]
MTAKERPRRGSTTPSASSSTPPSSRPASPGSTATGATTPTPAPSTATRSTSRAPGPPRRGTTPGSPSGGPCTWRSTPGAAPPRAAPPTSTPTRPSTTPAGSAPTSPSPTPASSPPRSRCAGSRAYGAPLLVVNAWLVLVTYLHHTHPALPRYAGGEWDWLRGALATVDRDFGAALNAAFHHIGDTHVAHHLFPAIPHYHAVEATAAIRPVLGEYYRFDGTNLAAAT